MYIHKRRTITRYSTAIRYTGRIRAVRNGYIWRLDVIDSINFIYIDDDEKPTRAEYLNLFRNAQNCIFDERYMRTSERLDRNQHKRYTAWRNSLKRRGRKTLW